MNEAQYVHVRKLLQCGHAYAKIEDYITAYMDAIDKMSQAETNADHKSWFGVCVIIRELALLRFGAEGGRQMQQAAAEYAKQS